jgi:hypothetical protein
MKTVSTMFTSSTMFSSRRSRRRLFRWVSVLVLVAGIVVFTSVHFRNAGKSAQLPLRSTPAQIAKKEKSVPLSPEARRVAGRFILTAVARRDLAESWHLVDPSLREGFTLAEWKTGDIPVVPYPVDSIDVTPFKIDYSYANRALLEIALLPKAGTKVKPQLFFLRLRARGSGEDRRWLVDYWIPRGAALTPSSGG